MARVAAKSSARPKVPAERGAKLKAVKVKRLTKPRAALLYERLALDRPDPKTELNYTNAYTLLVAVTLSAQSTDVGVNKATKSLFEIVDTPEKMIALGEEKLKGFIKTIGFWRSKARHVIAMSRILVEQHGGKVPRDRESLEALPGVGRKTANVVLHEIFHEPTIAVDTHVFRVSNRTKLAPGATPDAVEAELMKITPEPYRHGAHHLLLLHGRYVCIARKPNCPLCVIRDICLYEDKTPPGADLSSKS